MATPLLNTQKDLCDQITKLYSNFKKTSKQRHTPSYLTTRCELLESYWRQFMAQNSALVQTVSDEEYKNDPYFTQNTYDIVEETYLEFKTIIKESLSEKLPIQVTQPQASMGVGPQAPSCGGSHNSYLPKITLPQFSGKYTDWTHFKDMFHSIIHNVADIPPIRKHQYLRSCLTGEADQLLRHFDITAENYNNAWETLEQRYSNERIIANHIFSRLLNQKKMNTECPKALKDLLDTTRECLNALQNIKIDTKTWDAIIVHIIVSRLDAETHKAWEQSLGASRVLPSFNDLSTFIEGRFRAIEMVQAATTKREFTKKDTSQRPCPVRSYTTEVESECTFCSKNHYICHCTDFTKLDIDQRREFVKNNGICFNCLIKGHSIKFCKQTTTCKKCGRRHHTLLHNNSYMPVSSHPITQDVEVQIESDTDNAEVDNTAVTSMKIETSSQVVLATAFIGVKGKDGVTHQLRALVDPGSQASFITESATQTLGLLKEKMQASVTGIGSNTVLTRNKTSFDIYSLIDGTHVTKVNAIIMNKLTQLLPSKKINLGEWPEIKQLRLSDPTLHTPGPIDVLLGADIYSSIILEGLHKREALVAQNSRLGWVISGKVEDRNYDNPALHIQVHHAAMQPTDVDSLLKKFWETEEYLPHEKPLTILEKQCEEHYQKTHSRNPDGRYVVKLPFHDDHEQALGNSRYMALHRLHQMEKRFKNQPKFHQDYQNFIDEYQTMGHMEDVDSAEPTLHKVYYLPHHAVIRESSTTTKLRVVFDGSAQPKDGRSLNDQLLIGPPLQNDIRDLIIRWRQHKICLVADIQKMFRNILVAKEDTDYQRVLWRNSPDDPVVEKRLLTVTYGTSSAPFLAIRTLHQLADDESEDFPELVSVIKNDYFVDDLLTGAQSESEALQLQRSITKVMERGKLELHKWSSNSAVVLNEIPQSLKAVKESVNIKLDESVKTLGIPWNSQQDGFELMLDVSPPQKIFTKTTVLSDIAKCFDPLGFLGPVIVTAKMFLQKLWLAGVDWKDELPVALANEWAIYRDKLLNMDKIFLKRWLNTNNEEHEIREVHGFSDASTLAFSAVVYLRVINSSGIHVSLLIAKTKVAPVKQVSLPRLELCGAVLLSKLLKDVKVSLKIPDNRVFAWTDSTIVLSWLRKNPNTWKTYVANRTTEILNVTSSDRWHHIKSADNPADVASRGISPELLKDCDLWFKGPQFLHDKENISYSSSTHIPETNIESRTNIATNVVTHTRHEEILSYLNRYSQLSKLLRVTAYVLRFITTCKKNLQTNKNDNQTTTSTQHLSAQEIINSLNYCIRMSQEKFFHNEIQVLRKKGKIPKSSKLYSLTPFLDENQLLRIRGRLHNAPVCFDAKSPIILSGDCHLSGLIVHDAHIRVLHGGPQLTLNVIRKKYWIIGAKNLVKRVIHRCIPCFKQTAAPINQLMGHLPSARVTPVTKCFQSAGVDFAGPITLKLYRGRCQKTSKAYICLFVCTVSKAIHLELVSDLSTTAFIAAFRRFTSRRGQCSNIWSDCGTNFVGAATELDKMFKTSQSQSIAEIAEVLANDNTTWHFIPPGSPHFGGLWEAGVKSVKTHLKRVIGQTLLTFEEYATLLTQVEACVNSRPLTQISTNFDDCLPLTPGHFLIGESPITLPDDNNEPKVISHLDRWQMIQRMLRSLWTRWSSEYLTSLQVRYKWADNKSEPEIGTVVLVKDERLPPGKWLLGRIIEKHPGKDNLTRVVTLKYKNSTFKRPITKLCPLPIDT